MNLIIANAIWPAIYLVAQSATLWPIAISIIIEYLVLRHVSTLSWNQALLYVIVANASSALVGAIPLVFIGLGWEFLLSALANIIPGPGPGSFSALGWTVTTIIASLISASLEYLLLKQAFKVPFKFRHAWFIWWVANLFTAAIATISIIYFPLNL